MWAISGWELSKCIGLKDLIFMEKHLMEQQGFWLHIWKYPADIIVCLMGEGLKICQRALGISPICTFAMQSSGCSTCWERIEMLTKKYGTPAFWLLEMLKKKSFLKFSLSEREAIIQICPHRGTSMQWSSFSISFLSLFAVVTTKPAVS